MASHPELLNAFSREYLEAVNQRDEPVTSIEADTAEPWELRPAGNRFALFRPRQRRVHRRHLGAVTRICRRGDRFSEPTPRIYAGDGGWQNVSAGCGSLPTGYRAGDGG